MNKYQESSVVGDNIFIFRYKIRQVSGCLILDSDKTLSRRVSTQITLFLSYYP
jgi:hypothetical protein